MRHRSATSSSAVHAPLRSPGRVTCAKAGRRRCADRWHSALDALRERARDATHNRPAAFSRSRDATQGYSGVVQGSQGHSPEKSTDGADQTLSQRCRHCCGVRPPTRGATCRCRVTDGGLACEYPECPGYPHAAAGSLRTLSQLCSPMNATALRSRSSSCTEGVAVPLRDDRAAAGCACVPPSPTRASEWTCSAAAGTAKSTRTASGLHRALLIGLRGSLSIGLHRAL